jgi:hypothetical protein
MAVSTITAELAAMGIIPTMTGSTTGGSASINIVYMATSAGHTDMFSRQLKTCQVVVETGRQPAIGGMTIATIQAKTARVFVILRVAGKTIVRRTFIDIVNMAAGALNGRMFADQFETRQAVIEKGRDPRFRIMAGGTEGA